MTRKVSYYHWGEFEREEEIDEEILIDTDELLPQEIAGFTIRCEDMSKIFYASAGYIDTDIHGTSVKHAYAIG